MKKIIILSIATIMVLTGCNRNKIAQLEHENENLRAEKEIALELQEEFNELLIDIEKNLAEIKAKEKRISQNVGERPQSQRQKILQDLADISELMDVNRTRLAELDKLRRQMREANLNTQKMEELIKTLEYRIEEQEAQIKELQEQLRIANEKIIELRVENQHITEENEKKQAKIDEQIISLNTAYYTLGTSQSLKESGVITQKGGFIGIGKTRTINEAVNLRNFTKVDIREFSRLETNSDKIEIITPHPPESYRLNNTDPKNIVIEVTQPDVFWKSSKYLVVRVR